MKLPDSKIVLLILSSLLFGIFLMNKALFHYDAIVLAEAVEKSYATFRLHPSTNYRYADVIIVSIFYFPFWLAGQTADFAVRLTGIVFYSASIGVLYVFLKKFTNNTLLALTASALLAVHPIYLSPNTFGKIHGISLFFLFLSFWLILSPSRKNLAISAIAYAAGIASRESILFFLPFALVLVIFSLWKNKIAYREFLIFGLLFAALFGMMTATYFYPILEQTFAEKSAETAFFTYRPANMQRALQDLLSTSGKLLSVISLIGMIGGAVTLRFPALFLAFWLLSSFFYFSNFTTYEARYLDVVVAPLFAFAGLTVSYVMSKKKIAGYILFAALFVAPVLYTTQLMIPRTTYNGIYEFGKLINEKTEPDAIIIVQNEAPVVGYYGKRQTLGPPTGEETESMKFWKNVHANITKGQNIWLAFSAFFHDPGDINKQIVSQAFDFSKTYSTINEDYHHSDIRQLRYITYLWKLSPKNSSEGTSIPTPFILKGVP